MMKDKKEEEMLKVKEQVLSNLETMQIAISRFTDEGMIDLNDALYNHVVDLLEEARAMEEIEEFENIVILAKKVEVQLDMWLSSVDRDSTELPWPTFR